MGEKSVVVKHVGKGVIVDSEKQMYNALAISMRLVMLDAIFHFKFNNFRILNPNLDML
jgi:hypothetical protein